MTESHDDRTPVEHDPTGMRALLASLPEPGPMPEDLVSRITAALAAEADAGSSASGATVVPLPRRRLQLKHLGVAAAVVGALGLGGVVLSTAPNGLTASGGDESAQDARSAVGGSPQGGAESGAGSAGVALVPAAGTGEVVVVMSGRAYEAATLGEGADLLARGQDELLRSLAAESPGIGPIGTPIGARTCADALGVPSSAGVLVDVAEVDGRPAAVLVVDAGAGTTAYAVERSCTTGTTGLIDGPVVVR